MIPRAVTLILAGAVGACAPASAGGGRSVPDRSVVEAAQLAATGATDLYTALRQIRPEFLQARGVSSIHSGSTPDLPVVYLDGVEIGGPDELNRISTADVREVRRLSAHEAAARNGTYIPGGAILVFLKKGR